MTKARTLADFISDGSPLADGTISVSEVSGAAPIASPTFTGNINAGDNVKIRLGDSNDLQIYHDESNSYIDDAGTGDLYLRSSNDLLFTNADGSETYARFQENGYVRLFHNNALKFATSSTGVDITGDVGADTATITGKTTTDELDLSALAATISDTAVDVFVYDTSKDSDGGAWRKRTQGTSWYNETLNTATRGSRKEFPAVAVIVAESNQVTIYDGDDPDLPMWMVFNQTAVNYLTIYDSPKAVTAMNGILVCGGHNGTYGRVALIDFNYDRATDYKTLGSWGNVGHAIHPSPIVGRNSGSSGSSAWTKLSEDNLVSDIVNDVAMTVLPNAPIDAATGLPVPTIAVATSGGVSVIKDDGTVVDITGTSQGSDMPIDQISFVGNHSVMFSHRYASEVSTIPSSDSTAAYYNQVPTFTGRITNSISHDDDTHLAALSSDNNIESIAIDADNAVSKSVSGVSRHNHFAIAGDTDRASAFITSDYNTGWMNGDIKLATLSDTDDTDVTGSELVTNGTFDSDTSGWSNGAASYTTFAWDAGTIEITASGGTGRVRSPAIAVVAGKTYTFSVEVTAKTQNSGSFVHLGTSAGASNIKNNITQGEAVGTSAHTFTAITSSVFIELGAINGNTVNYDNVSLRLAEKDRSVNGNGLQVVGTVTKNPVATGADLVGYSGWSTTGAKSNYLYQPYNSDLDFGTNFCFITWVKVDGAVGSQDQHFFDLSPVDLSGRINVFWNHAATSFQFASGNGGTNVATSSLGYGNWHQLVCTASASSTQIYLDGALSSTGAGGFNHVLQSDAYLTIGARTTEYSGNAYGLNGSVALMRLSKTIPSPEQIKKIYEDEKVLFQENSQATLYGSSDAVTALAYDDTTELLHVGTSAGRSVFQGLRRVDNTTDAVGAAISASNGLVAED